jgi:hypothetical protein
VLWGECVLHQCVSLCDGDHVAFYFCFWEFAGEGYWRKSSHSVEWRQNLLKGWASGTEIKKVSLGEPESLIRSVLGGWGGIWTISPIGDSRRQLIFWTSQEGDDDDGNGEIVFFFIFAGRVTSSSVLFWPTTFQWFPQPPPLPLWRSCVCVRVCVRVGCRHEPPPILPTVESSQATKGHQPAVFIRQLLAQHHFSSISLNSVTVWLTLFYNPLYYFGLT